MKLAVLLDLDNLKPRLESLESLLERHGQTVYRRAFANSPAVMASYGSDFRRFNYRCEIVPGQPALPEEVDQLIFRTADEIANNPSLGVKVLAVVSNDNGYAALFERLRRRGIRTIAIGTNVGLRLREAAHAVEQLDELLRPLYLGIDLGTTNTVVAIASRTQETAAWTAAVQELPLPDEQGWLQARPLIPSAVRFAPDQTVVGGMARAQAAAWRDSTILDWKHQIGTARLGEPFAYELPAPQNSRISAHPWAEQYSKSGRVLPEEAAAALLQTCRDQLLEQGRQVRGIVLTHPASYEVDAVEATRRAALLSGWKEDEVVLLPEPHAALYDFLQRAQAGDIALDQDLSQPTNLVVYDLGGGTLDVSLHEVCWNSDRRRYDIRDLAVGSRTRVGGDLVDDLFASYMLEYHPEIRRLQEEDRERARIELRLYAEKFKKMWGSQYAAAPNRENLKLPFQTQLLEGRLPVRVPMDVETIRRILEPVLCPDLSLADVQPMDPSTAFDDPPFTDRLNTFVVPVLELLLKARQNMGEIPRLDGVLLNGGMTLFPLVRERLKTLFGAVPLLTHGHPDHAVGRGAALFAAGAQGKRAIRVNPTHISLEVQEEGRPVLRRLVAQGQAFPHSTTIQGMRLPAAERGELLFRIWVGMGNRPGQNTSLQRFRRVDLARLQEAGLAPGSEVNLQVDLSFEERLALTLQDPRSSARFQLEVREREEPSGPEPRPASLPGGGAPTPASTTSGLLHLLPSIERSRGFRPAEGPPVDIGSLRAVAGSLARFPNDGPIQTRLRQLVVASAVASNRLGLADSLLSWLSGSGHRASAQLHVALCVLPAILEAEATGSQAEDQFMAWVKGRYHLGLQETPNQVRTPLAEIPGRLLWEGWEELLMEGFNELPNQGLAQSFLNAMGKCCRPTPKVLEFLRRHSEARVLAVREKACWALARLNSPGQPPEYRVTPEQGLSLCTLALNRLEATEEDPRTLLSLTACLFQGLSWTLRGATPSPEVTRRVQNLRMTRLRAYPRLGQFQQIRNEVQKRIELLPSLLAPARLTESEQEVVKGYLLEVAR